MENKGNRTNTVYDEKYRNANELNQKIVEIQKEEFDGDNNFIDYFIVIGVKPEIFKNSYLYNSSSIDDINQNLIPQIITKFPKIDKKHIVVENSLPHQIFPKGFNAIESETRPENQFYSVILDNQLYSATYTHKFIACLLIYENLQSYEELYQKYKPTDLLSNIMQSNSLNIEKQKKNENYKKFYIPKCLCLVSVYPAFNRLFEILDNLYNLVLSNQYKNLYVDRIIEKMIMEIPKLPRGLKEVYLSLPNNNSIKLTEKKMNDFPCVNINLPKFFSTLDLPNILEIFRFLLFEMKLIFFSSKLFDLTNCILSFISLIYPFKYQFQIVSILPQDLYNFIETISPYIFGINETYDENFFNKNKIQLEDATICIIDIDRNKYYIKVKNEKTLAKEYPPFPKNLKEKIEKDFNKYKKEKESNRKSKENNPSIKLDEENHEYQLIFFHFMISLLKDYPKYLSKDYGVTKDISMSIKDMIDLTAFANSFNVNEREFYNRIFLTQMFIEFIYKRMMPKNYNEKVDILFFEEKINETKLKKSFFKSKDSGANILLTSQEYNYDDKIIYIDCASDISITPNVYDYIMENKDAAKKMFINNGYDIDIDEKNHTVNFNYHIFPSLLSDKFFIYNYEYYKKPELYCSAIDEINLKILNKSNLQFKSKSKEMITEAGNDIYLCYLIIWSLSLWYTDKDERELRFIDMLEIIEKVQVHDIQIFELLFKALVDIKWIDKDIILLYKKFIHLNLNPTWKIFTMVSKIIKKKQNVKNKKELLSQETKYKAIKNNNIKIKRVKTRDQRLAFQDRTLKIKSIDDKILFEDVIFYGYGKCSICNNFINLINLCSNLSQLKTKKEKNKGAKLLLKKSAVIFSNLNLKRDEEYKIIKNEAEDSFKCPNKHQKEGESEYTKFKLRLNHGVELFNLKMSSNKDSSSINYTTQLMSPTTIKNELLKISIKLEEEKEKFDVENFKKNNKRLFWNLIWYFQLNQIDIAFMLPYSSESQYNYDIDLEKLEHYISTKRKPDKDINIEKIVKNKDLNVEFLVCNNRGSLKGENINEEEIRKDLFNKHRTRYEKYDLIEQKIFRFHISDEKGMVSYLGFNNYSDNLGYNEYPIQYQDIEENTINYLTVLENAAQKKKISFKDSNDAKVSVKKNSLILDEKYSDNIMNKVSTFFNKNLNKLNTVNLDSRKDNMLKKSNLKLGKKLNENNANFVNPEKEDIIKMNKEIEIEESKEIKENEEEDEDSDLLSQFKQNRHNIKNELEEFNYEEQINNKLAAKSKLLRRSTLRTGILEGDSENND